MGNALGDGRRAQAALFHMGYRAVTLTVGAEDTNVLPVTVQLVDAGGQSVAEVQRCEAYVVGEAAAAFVVAETGAGAELSNTARPALAFTTSAAGVAEISVTDVVGASGDTVTLVVRPLDVLSAPSSAEVTFD